MRITELSYDLPPASIATQPAEPRDHSRLMVVRRSSTNTNSVEHRHFHNLPEYLHGGGSPDLLVVNDTRVLPAKLLLHRKSGAAIPGLFLAEPAHGVWEVMLRTRGKAKPGEELLAGPYSFLLESRIGDGIWRVRVHPPTSAAAVLADIGHIPLPPYIEKQRKHAGSPEENAADRHWYQTVYARTAQAEGRSVAAPTAGLHFTPALLARLDQQGIKRTSVELEVGPGTFLPVETETLEEHPMHSERYSVPAQTVAALRLTRATRGRTLIVGTTAVRTLEATASQILDLSTPPTDLRGTTTLKIAPGFPFQLTDLLITNFHLPKSTLMALVSAFLGDNGIARLKDLYTLAIKEGYRFYSYGDAMLILP